MGSFEKLGILVIVVIIVMILAVAVYQWGGDGVEQEYPTLEPEGTVIERDLGEPPKDDTSGTIPSLIVPPPAPSIEWPANVPKRYTVRPNDNLWDLVIEDWRLREGFIDQVKRANPGVNWKRLKPGQQLTIPDPREYVRGAPKKKREPAPASRRYRIQEGDTLELIAKKHLGAKSRWQEIRDLNPDLRPDRLRPGKWIHLPVK